MSAIVSLIFLAFAVSLDSFSTGLAYGMRKLKLPLKSSIILSCCSAGALLLSMLLGKFMASFLSERMTEMLGGIILILLGIWVIYQFFHDEKEEVSNSEKLILKLEIKSLGVVINILRKPSQADFDKSGTITGLEAFMLGIALSLDAFAAGIGAAFLGYSPAILAASVAVMSIAFVSAGLSLGRMFAHLPFIQRIAFLPGVLLILVGILKM
ncbi:MAG TPA: sporulation membrane protein YtaF [Chondromyces sp.]|nr:sporulation membrane protein YtaF [Chondromyces sp.]